MSIFLSTVTSEFGDIRKNLGNQLGARGISYRTQEEFSQGQGTLLERLAEYIGQCDAIIHLVGETSGAFPESDDHVDKLHEYLVSLGVSRDDLPPADTQYSYTQWEYRIARLLKKAVYVYMKPMSGPVADSSQRRHREFIAKSGKHYTELQQQFSYLTETMRDLGLSWFRKPANLPYGTIGSLFKGRQEFLEKLRRILGKIDIENPPSPIVVHGLGGVGKTRVAVEYAHHHEIEYTALLWVRAESPEAFQSELANLWGVIYNNNVNLIDSEQKLCEVVEWLKNHPGWFLIIDNVDDDETAKIVKKTITDFQSRGHLLVTTRLTRWTVDFKELKLDVLDSESAVEYLCEAAHLEKNDTDARDEAVAVAKELGYLSLALEQAAAFVRVHEIRFPEYLEELRINGEEVRKWHDESTMHYPESIATAWITSFNRLTDKAKLLLECFSFLSIEPIPRRDLTEPPLLPGEKSLLTPLADLAKYSLVYQDRNTSSVTLHPLVQQVTRFRIPEAERTERLMTVLRWMDAMASKFTMDLVPHVERATEFGLDAGLYEPTLNIRHRADEYLLQRCDFLRVRERCLEMPTRLRHLTGTDRYHLARFNRLAGYMAAQNHQTITQAVSCYIETEEILGEMLNLEPEHADWLYTLQQILRGLGNIGMRLEDIKLAERRYLESLGISYRLAEKDVNNNEWQRQLSASLIAMGDLSTARNDHDKAEEYFRESLDIMRRLVEKEANNDRWQSGLSASLGKMGDLRKNRNDIDEAEKHFRESLDIRHRLAGKDASNDRWQIDLAEGLSRMGGLKEKCAKPDEAEKYYRESLGIRRRLVKKDETNVEWQINLVISLQEINDTDSLKEGHAILKKLERNGTLPPDQVGLIQYFEDRLAELESD